MGELPSFQDVIGKINKPKILLGNGFSIAYDSKRFSFTSLLDSAVENKIIEKDSKVYKVFESLQTSDFESVMRALEETKKIIQVYEGDKELQELLKNDLENLKKYLVRIITNNHPSKTTEISSEQKISCAKFLDNFETIYTLNYDLLLYWSILQTKEITNKFPDGFGEDDFSLDEDYVIYKNNSSFPSKVNYLHGGLHIFDAGNEIIKKTYSKTDICLMTQIAENLDKGIYPIFVSEGDSKQKMTKILHNAYLNHCYRSLKKVNGNLVILGTNLKSNDDHILDAIMGSTVSNIYIGVSKIENVEHIRRRIIEFNDNNPIKKHKHLGYFDYKTVNPWDYITNKK
ncbi:MAG: DUF4917 family protein [Candidatus Gracilibacteria bacterium]|nr:DUF4917 family protein [Candidatus Gracilibacteria bacterium]